MTSILTPERENHDIPSIVKATLKWMYNIRAVPFRAGWVGMDDVFYSIEKIVEIVSKERHREIPPEFIEWMEEESKKLTTAENRILWTWGVKDAYKKLTENKREL